MIKSIAFICCDHGLGHIRRDILIARDLSKDYKVVVFAPQIKFNKFIKKNNFNETNLSFFDFATNTSPGLFLKEKNEIIKWINYLPNLKEFDYVICDNLPEILILRDDAILISQFFWHRVLLNVNKDYSEFCERLLYKYEPVVIGSKIFSMPYIKNLKNFKSVGIIVDKSNKQFSLNKKKEKNLLITGGSTSVINKQLFDLIKLIEANKLKSIDNIFLDPNLFINANKEIFKCADFSSNMYKNLDYSICRPGLGVLSELLFNKITPILIFEKNNFEMEYNSKKILENKLGYVLNKYTDIFSIIEMNNSKKIYDKLNFNGIDEITSFFKNNYY